MFQVAAAVTTPFDVVKTLRQIELTEKEIITGQLNLFNNLLRLSSKSGKYFDRNKLLKNVQK